MARPALPDPDNPKRAKWLRVIADFVASASEPIVLVGHSLGATAILRYLESKPAKPIRVAMLVAAPTDAGIQENRHPGILGFLKPDPFNFGQDFRTFPLDPGISPENSWILPKSAKVLLESFNRMSRFSRLSIVLTTMLWRSQRVNEYATKRTQPGTFFKTKDTFAQETVLRSFRSYWKVSLLPQLVADFSSVSGATHTCTTCVVSQWNWILGVGPDTSGFGSRMTTLRLKGFEVVSTLGLSPNTLPMSF